ncbi:lytic transglycosylase domain-containing protein [Streptomyces sp. FZ201]|uniref:lytic transglycosylase domain-containing protein n=1 Tax=Streptomyces sp. FZ201 TaxID=3057122 RepID=UPI0021C1B2EA|nr:lytic transglycosylase domain-containing protein [Streptomyces sp. FZ201]
MSAQFGRRLYKGAATAAVAALAVAALSGSQAPGVTVDDQGRRTTSDATPSPDAAADDSATGNSPYYTDLPPLDSPKPSPSAGGTDGGGTTDSDSGIPATVLDAYQQAAAKLQESKPGCNIPWELLAAIGHVESGHARGGKVDADGTTISPILGPQLNGNGFANISDTDNGAYDGDSSYDRAVGPMQFIPSTWEWAGRDGNGDGKKDPNNVYDAALAAGHYLCRFGWDLSDARDLRSAILSYNNSTDYLNTVLAWLEHYRKGVDEIPDGTGTVPEDRSDEVISTSPSPSTPAQPGTPSTPPRTTPPGTKPPATPPPTTPPTTPPPTKPQTPTESVHHLEDAGTEELSARAGDAFAERISTRAETRSGKGVGKVRIRFTVVGDTDAVFTGGEKVATALTDSSGTAVAPALQAGGKTGEFKVRATLIGRSVTAVEYRAKVTERTADALARTTETELTCVPGGEFAERVKVKATYKGAVADGVAATATLIKSAEDATENDKGPYFKDDEDKPVRTLTGLKTDKDGLIELPKLYADDAPGTYLLRITTAGGATLTVELTVAEAGEETPETPETTTPSPSASPTA